MEFDTTQGQERVIVQDLAELSAVRVVMSAFVAFMDRNDFKSDLVDHAREAAVAVEQAHDLSLTIRQQSGVDSETVNQFGEPYATPINYAVTIYGRYPVLLEPYMDEAGLAEARVFFPPHD